MTVARRSCSPRLRRTARPHPPARRSPPLRAQLPPPSAQPPHPRIRARRYPRHRPRQKGATAQALRLRLPPCPRHRRRDPDRPRYRPRHGRSRPQSSEAKLSVLGFRLHAVLGIFNAEAQRRRDFFGGAGLAGTASVSGNGTPPGGRPVRSGTRSTRRTGRIGSAGEAFLLKTAVGRTDFEQSRVNIGFIAILAAPIWCRTYFD